MSALIETPFGIPLIDARAWSKELKLGSHGFQAYLSLPEAVQLHWGDHYYLTYLTLRLWLQRAYKLAGRTGEWAQIARDKLATHRPLVDDKFDIDVVPVNMEDADACPCLARNQLELIVDCAHADWLEVPGIGSFLHVLDAYDLVEVSDPVFAEFLLKLAKVRSVRKYRSLVQYYRSTAELADRQVKHILSSTTRRREYQQRAIPGR